MRNDFLSGYLWPTFTSAAAAPSGTPVSVLGEFGDRHAVDTLGYSAVVVDGEGRFLGKATNCRRLCIGTYRFMSVGQQLQRIEREGYRQRS